MERGNKEQVKDAILDAVIHCKYEAGGGDIQITQIAAQAGVSTRTLNRYFPDKDKMIYLAAIRFLNGRYAAFSQAYETRDLSGKTGMERIRLLFEMHAEHYRLNPIDAIMVDSANLRYTMGSLETDYPKMQVGLSLRKIFFANVELGWRDGSIRGDVNAQNAWVLVSDTYNGLLHRLAYLNAGRCETLDRDTFFLIYDDYIGMIEKFLGLSFTLECLLADGGNSNGRNAASRHMQK